MYTIYISHKTIIKYTMRKGLFIVFEGNNGAGKTTIINYHRKSIYFWNVYKFPNRNTILGKKIDDFLKKKIKLTKDVELKFFADNRKEFQLEMEYILNKGYNIICDRYIYSSMAYTITNQTLEILNDNEPKLLSIGDTIKYDKNYITPDYVFLIKGNYLHLRKEKQELYHKNQTFNNILFNNYILALQHLNTPFAIIDNVYGELEETICAIMDIIDGLQSSKYII